jgi:hypothetical protein
MTRAAALALAVLHMRYLRHELTEDEWKAARREAGLTA